MKYRANLASGTVDGKFANHIKDVFGTTLFNTCNAWDTLAPSQFYCRMGAMKFAIGNEGKFVTLPQTNTPSETF